MISAQQKTELLARVRKHAKMDHLAQGRYASVEDQQLSVCAVGCAMVDPSDPLPLPDLDDWHEAQEERWGIPAWLGKLEDDVFEGLPFEQAREWPVRFVDALPVGVELGDSLRDRLAVRRLREVVLPLAPKLAPTWPDDVRDRVVAAVESVINALENDGDREAARRMAACTEDGATASVWAARAAAEPWLPSWAAWAANQLNDKSAFWRGEADRIIEELRKEQT